MGFFSTIKEKFGGSFGGGDDGMDPDEEIYGTYGEDDEFIGDDDYGQEYIEDEEDDGIGGSNPFGGVDRVSAYQGRKNTSTQKHSSAAAIRAERTPRRRSIRLRLQTGAPRFRLYRAAVAITSQ